jgi:N-acetylglucosaminyldiphosphoundecaprenol N-acetyl-beta-D-mannosaminyltransferase
MGVDFDSVTESGALDALFAGLAARRGGLVLTANLDHLRRAQSDARFAQIARTADLVVADGMPIVWAARLAGRPLPQRVAGSTMVFALCARAAREGRSVFLLGGNPGVADHAAGVLTSQHAGLRICGTLCPPFGFESDAGKLGEIRDAVRAARPDIVLVALGSPKQEYLAQTLRGDLPGAWWIGVGISLSFVTGEVRRAPAWMQRAGLEWIHRLASEPRRLARRYLVDGLPFAARLFLHALGSRGKSAG